MSGGNTQRFRPPWVKDGPNPVPKATVPWRTKDKNAAAASTVTNDQPPNAVFYNFKFKIMHIFAMRFV